MRVVAIVLALSFAGRASADPVLDTFGPGNAFGPGAFAAPPPAPPYGNSDYELFTFTPAASAPMTLTTATLALGNASASYRVVLAVYPLNDGNAVATAWFDGGPGAASAVTVPFVPFLGNKNVAPGTTYRVLIVEGVGTAPVSVYQSGTPGTLTTRHYVNGVTEVDTTGPGLLPAVRIDAVAVPEPGPLALAVVGAALSLGIPRAVRPGAPRRTRPGS